MLSKEEFEFLDTFGYLNLGQLLTDDQVKQVNERITDLMRSEGERAGKELAESRYIRHPKEEGADRLADLVNKGEVFDVFYTHPRVLAGIEAVLGQEYKLSSLNYRAAKPNQGLQKLHVDWKNTVVNGAYQVCNSIWLLDDFTEFNGSTRIVPTSHKWNELPDEAMSNPLEKHPEEIRIIAPAGSVFIFNSHVWHGGTTNQTDRVRRSIHSYFCSRAQAQQIDQKKYITEDTLARIGEQGKWILDV
ncbi:phytanoyl-CoA dioxygenase family protein [Algoriphagus halophytocola]|uniref:Phytanoyl-CoA dioxygenase family protein n=1 Tax=Algoriphagus halophytocola TaxID=2991499 RepID=A0ABY6MHU3_9BACT|nr:MULTISPECIES: phytanoyl-CoA dioxygenase family protein [unclassified Algoriphagus]UZD22600.1 phytanoyl-CoA dioxygenase family protein [Algoriphagus sp. TR-M5]WBL43866.1 phytanoyl-CoA dioxygenase family protein [Algoriphagus sp. TR-M9]